MIIEFLISAIYFATILLAREDKIENMEEINYRKNIGKSMIYMIFGSCFPFILFYLGLFCIAIINSIISLFIFLS